MCVKAEEVDVAERLDVGLALRHTIERELRQGFEIRSFELIGQGALAVGLARGVPEQRALGQFHRRVKFANVGQSKFVMEPGLNHIVLTMILVVANQSAQSIGQIPGASAS